MSEPIQLTPEQINDRISARKAELRELEQGHSKLLEQAQQAITNNQARANQLIGMITALEDLLPKPEEKKDEPVSNP